jgi:hypothetical protein
MAFRKLQTLAQRPIGKLRPDDQTAEVVNITPAGDLLDKVRLVVAVAESGLFTSAEFRAFAVAALHFADTKTGKCYPSKRQLAEKSGTNSPTVKRMWAKAEAQGLVEIKHSNGGRNHRNTITIKRGSPANPLGEQRGSAADTRGVCSGHLRGSVADTHISNPLNPTQISIKEDSRLEEKEERGFQEKVVTFSGSPRRSNPEDGLRHALRHEGHDSDAVIEWAKAAGLYANAITHESPKLAAHHLIFKYSRR